ncbi:glycosyltransferase family 2 protein [Synechococcus sp. PCC 7502]|uniref:glycosyltransferase n=1 Tax=Synechococcus sp. PCC 7502 TaxID=1173263 RepID=UPI0002E4229D|nr:glycosyltransferase family 2 protein [Synechococcus sp. PCC 7502]
MDQDETVVGHSPKGEMRRLKAAIALGLIYGTVFLLHLSSWGLEVVMVVLGILTIHALRLLLTSSSTSTYDPSTDQNYDENNLPELPLVSLVVAAKNEEAVISKLVEGLCQIDYESNRLELWVVDDNSNDRTPLILEKLQQKYQQLKVLRRGVDAQGGKSGALNQVLPLTTGEIIGVFDADAQVPKNLLTALLPLFHKPKIGAVQLRKAIANAGDNFWTRGQAAEMALDIFFQRRRNNIKGIGELRGNGQFVRRSALISCGGWNEQTITDDLDLTIRLHLDHWDIGCLTHPAVNEEGVLTLKQLWHQRNRWAEGGYQRYLDYWQPIIQNQMGLSKTFDLAIFLLIQYILPTAIIPDLLGAIVLHKRPLLTPILAMTTILSTIGMAVGVKQSYRSSLFSTLIQTLRGTIYMLHWIPVMVSVTLRMSIRPKQLKWVKTMHQGLGNSLGLDELDNEFKSEH